MSRSIGMTKRLHAAGAYRRFVESKGMAESEGIQRTDAPAKFV
jgi:hypothetical protein